jgi:hypothetical protein
MWNLLAIVISVNVLVLLALCIAAFFTGYLIRSGFIKGCRKRISELEKEMLRDNARILELEKEKVELMKSLSITKEQ